MAVLVVGTDTTSLHTLRDWKRVQLWANHHVLHSVDGHQASRISLWSLPLLFSSNTSPQFSRACASRRVTATSYTIQSLKFSSISDGHWRWSYFLIRKLLLIDQSVISREQRDVIRQSNLLPAIHNQSIILNIKDRVSGKQWKRCYFSNLFIKNIVLDCDWDINIDICTILSYKYDILNKDKNLNKSKLFPIVS